MFVNINHDFRTPLTLINGYLSRIIKNENNYLTGETEEDLEKLRSNTSTLIKMTEEIQNLLLLEESTLKLNFNRVKINDHLSLLVKMFSSAAFNTIIDLKFESRVSKELFIHIDQYHFENIIYNL